MIYLVTVRQLGQRRQWLELRHAINCHHICCVIYLYHILYYGLILLPYIPHMWFDGNMHIIRVARNTLDIYRTSLGFGSGKGTTHVWKGWMPPRLLD